MTFCKRQNHGDSEPISDRPRWGGEGAEVECSWETTLLDTVMACICRYKFIELMEYEYQERTLMQTMDFG